MADYELLLRCDCGVEHLDIDIWLQAPPAPADGYLSFTSKVGGHGLIHRLRGCWALLRGREYMLSEVLLKPEDLTRLRTFLQSLPR